MSVQVAEFVGRGHPDKIADTIADRLMEVLLSKDIEAQFACEVLASKGLIVVAGELSSKVSSKLDVKGVVVEVLTGLGYDGGDFEVIDNMKEQSVDIRCTSVKSRKGVVSGDQSIVVGYANSDTDNYLPLSFEVARGLIKRMDECEIKGAKKDCKSMVILDGRRVERLILSVQHEADVNLEEFRDELYGEVVEFVGEKYGLELKRDRVFINSSEKFVIGGLDADTGMTNRKLMVDSYGIIAAHGGGGYSGKDLTKVDRVGAYYARWICKNLVAAGVCESIELVLVFRYGSEKPKIYIRKFESKYSEGRIIGCIKKAFDLSFEEIYHLFNRPGISYSRLSHYGHFGDSDVPWEELTKVDEIKEHIDED